MNTINMNKIKILLAIIALACVGTPALSSCARELPVVSQSELTMIDSAIGNEIDEERKEHDEEVQKCRTDMATFLVSLGLLDNSEKYGVNAQGVALEVVTDVYAATYYDGTTPLMAALYLEEYELAEDILAHTANVNAANEDGITALMNATCQGSEAFVDCLLARHADVEATTSTGHSALMFACMRGADSVPVVARLLAARAVVDRKEGEYGESSLMMAAWQGHDMVVRALLENGATVDACREDDTGVTALFLAAENNHLSTAQLLLEFNADPCFKNKQGKLPLHTAFAGGHQDMFALLANAMMETGNIEVFDAHYLCQRRR